MNTKSKKTSLLMASLLLNGVLLSQTLSANQAEIVSFTAQKHRADFNALEEKAKQSVTEQYMQTAKLAEILKKSDMKNDVDFKVATDLAAVTIWANKFMKDFKVSDAELKKIYETQKPNKEARYNIRNILVKEEASADKIIKALASNKTIAGKLDGFKKHVTSDSLDLKSKQNGGVIGWMNFSKLDKRVQLALKDKKAGDLVKVNIDKIGTQVLLIEGFEPQKAATFEESKQALTQNAKQEALSKEIQKRLK